MLMHYNGVMHLTLFWGVLIFTMHIDFQCIVIAKMQMHWSLKYSVAHLKIFKCGVFYCKNMLLSHPHHSQLSDFGFPWILNLSHMEAHFKKSVG